MKFIARTIFALSFFLGGWVVASFIAVMANASNIDFWTTSLMWSLLASVIVLPVLVLWHHASSYRATGQRSHAPTEAPTPALDDKSAFIDEEDRKENWPFPDASSTESK